LYFSLRMFFSEYPVVSGCPFVPVMQNEELIDAGFFDEFSRDGSQSVAKPLSFEEVRAA
jgi:hypothetical protein